MLLETPYGTTDVLNDDALLKRTIEDKLRTLFRKWGYDEIVTPTIEYIDTLIGSNNSSIETSLFKLFDHNNRTLALRHEMTTPLARVVSSKLKDDLPLKLSYISNVFRLEETQRGRQCEFNQAGVEIMGINTPAADAEIIALCIECIRSLDIQDFQIHLGHVNFFQGLLDETLLDYKLQSKIKAALQRRDIVLLKNTIESLTISQDMKFKLLQIPLLIGDQTLLDNVRNIISNTKSIEALNNLSDIYVRLQAYGLSKYIRIDLSTIRDFDYYTGMVFEGYTPRMGFPICGGGRYDNLLDQFGFSAPATGFAIGIERLGLILPKEIIKNELHHQRIYIGYDDSGVEQAIIRAKELRNLERHIIDLALMPQTKTEVESIVKLKNYNDYEYFI